MATFFARWKRKSWSVLKEEWENGKRTQKTVPKELLFSEYGFRPDMTLEEAKRRVKQLNKLGKLNKHQAVEAARRSKFEESIKDVFLDQKLVDRFRVFLLEESFGTEENNKKLISHWNTISKIVLELRILPHEFAEREAALFKYFIKQKYSLDYVAKLVRILNVWGGFVCKYQNRHYQVVKVPKGNIRGRIAESYLTKETNRSGGSKGLTAILLSRAQDKFKIPGQYEWMFVCFWFGLRPKEVDNLSNKENWFVTTELDKTEVLHINQPKLVTLLPEDRWKLIPVLYPEQKIGLQHIKAGNLVRPLRKTVQAIFGEEFGLYSPRKGFTDEMLDQNNPLEDISAWLGHRTLDRTWRHYKNKKRVRYKKIG